MQPRRILIGRARELELLVAACAETRAGTGGMVLLAGEAGVGKSVLARRLVAATDLRSLTGRCREDSTPPYGPVAAVLREWRRGRAGAWPLERSLQRQLGRLLPELGDPPDEVDPGTVAEAIGAALESVAREAPSLVLLEDLQWADEATLDLLPPLVERLRGAPLLLLATYRSDEIVRGHPLRRMRDELRRLGCLREIRVEPLDREGSAELIASVLGARPSPDLVETVHGRTLGVPLYVEELSRALAGSDRLRRAGAHLDLAPGRDVPLPESVRDAVLLRLDALAAEARTLLEVAAVAGTEFDVVLAANLAGSESGLEQLVERGFVVETAPGRASFRHALIREAVRGEIPWSRRRQLHRRIARSLDAAGAHPQLVAEHWLAAREHEAARRALLEACERSCRVYAYRDAARSAHRALEIWPEGEEEEARVETLERLAHCAEVVGQLNDALRALREALCSPLVRDDAERRGRVHRSWAGLHGVLGSGEPAIEAWRASAEAYRHAGRSHEAAASLLAVGERSAALLRLDDARRSLEEAVALGERAGRSDLISRGLGLLGSVLAMQGEAMRGRELAQRALDLALEHDLTDVASEAWRRLAGTLEYASDYAAAERAYASALDYCRGQGEEEQGVFCLGCMSWVLYQTGDWKRCGEVCREALAGRESPAAVAILGLMRGHRGEVRGARRLLRRGLELARREGQAAVELIALGGLGLVEEHDGDAGSAAGHYRALLEAWQRTQDRHDAIGSMCAAASFFAGQGLERETTLCNEAMATMADGGNPEALAGLAFALGEAALARRDAQQAARHFLHAAAHHEKLELPLQRACVAWRTGVALARSAERTESVRHLVHALGIARKLGARPLASRIAACLEAQGEPVEERRSVAARSERAGLTRRQLEVARLIADGLTNKEIAARLYLSTRTVDMHVRNLLDRLDCRSRSAAVLKASELGLLEEATPRRDS